MTDRPLVTFFVMAYNQERFIREAVAGAFAQTYEPLEIIISDDSSTDRTFEIIEEMASKYRGPHSVILNRNTENRGLIGHLDHIVEMSNGILIVASAGDDISESNRVSVLVETWEASDRRVSSIHSSATWIRTDGTIIRIRQPPVAIRSQPTPLDIVQGNLYVIGATQAWTRELYDIFGPLAKIALIEDRPLPFRASLLGGIAYIDSPLVLYREGGVSKLSKRISGQEHLYGQILMYKRWYASSYRSYLCDMKLINFPDRESCREICRERLIQLEFDIELAEVGYFGRIVKIPEALRLSLERKSIIPLKQTIKYLFDIPYMVYLDGRYKLFKWWRHS